jgi:hypothetical protein
MEQMRRAERADRQTSSEMPAGQAGRCLSWFKESTETHARQKKIAVAEESRRLTRAIHSDPERREHLANFWPESCYPAVDVSFAKSRPAGQPGATALMIKSNEDRYPQQRRSTQESVLKATPGALRRDCP